MCYNKIGSIVRDIPNDKTGDNAGDIPCLQTYQWQSRDSTSDHAIEETDDDGDAAYGFGGGEELLLQIEFSFVLGWIDQHLVLKMLICIIMIEVTELNDKDI